MGDVRRRGAVALGITGLVAPLTLALGATPAQAASCTTQTGPYQKQVEKFLGRPVDGKQSATDCKAIRAFQTKHGISPNIGYAGPVTWGVMDLMQKQKAVGTNPNKDGKCPVNKGRIACVNLTLQLSWINRTVGERTEANGFVEGIIILDDKFTKASGGGVSAVATTMYNALFFAGVKPVEHGAHSFYIERYPEGREATVAWGSLDLRFTNDSGKAIYIQAESTDTSVTVSFLGTREYDEIKSVRGPRTEVKKPSKKVSDDKECVPQTPLEGFDVTVERVFYRDGREVKREPYRTHYTPRDEIVCE
ncbi:hypothetical protein GCM10011428_54890 [Streptomyces violaceus]|uniref:VanW family protein n=1 Tax=Streptomyces violaceus TaxID=1936 RepID=UPI0033814E80